MRLRLSGLLFVATIATTFLAFTHEAHADTAAMARFHHREAQRYYTRGRYQQAIEEFFSAQQLSPNPRTLYNIALCFMQLDQPVEAYHFFTAYMEGEDDVEGAEERQAYARQSIEQLIPRVARVTVETDPPGAEIYVDQEEHGSYGQTPRQLALAPGEHRIWVVMNGYGGAEESITAVLGEASTVRLELQRVLGRLQIGAALEASARVLDAAGALVAEGEVPLEADLPPGRYDVIVRALGYPPWRTVASVVASETERVHLSREDLPAPTGSLTITSNARNAEVRIAGQQIGFTPLSLTALRANAQRVEVRAPGLQPWEGEVSPRADARAWLNVTLRPVPAERSVWTWIVGGAGAAAVLTAVGTGIANLVEHTNLEQSKALGVDTSGTARTVDSLGLATDVLFVTGAALLGLAVILYFVTDRSTVPASSAAVSWGEE